MQSQQTIFYDDFLKIIKELTEEKSRNSKSLTKREELVLKKAKKWLDENHKKPNFDINQLVLKKPTFIINEALLPLLRNYAKAKDGSIFLDGIFYLLPYLVANATEEYEIALLDMVLEYKPEHFQLIYKEGFPEPMSLSNLPAMNRKKTKEIICILHKHKFNLSSAVIDFGSSPAQLAGMSGNIGMLDTLFELGVDIFNTGKKNMTLGEIAYLNDDKQLKEFCIKKQQYIVRPHKLFLIFAYDKNFKNMKKIKTDYPDLDVNYHEEEKQHTALMMASHHGLNDMVKYLLEECKANTQFLNKYGRNALCIAIREGHINCIKLLLEEDNAIQTLFIQKSALLTAVQNHSDRLHQTRALIINALLTKIKEDKSIDDKEKVKLLAMTDEEGYTALHIAVLNLPFSIINMLLSCPFIDVNVKGGADQLTSLELAVVKDNELIFTLLLNNKKVEKNFDKLIQLAIKHNAKKTFIKIIEDKTKDSNGKQIDISMICQHVADDKTITDDNRSALIDVLLHKMSQEKIGAILAYVLERAIIQNNIKTIEKLLPYTSAQTLSQEGCDLLIKKAAQNKLHWVTNKLNKIYPKEPQSQQLPGSNFVSVSEASEASVEEHSHRFFAPLGLQTGKSGFAYNAENLGLEKAKDLKQALAENKLETREKNKDKEQSKDKEQEKLSSCCWLGDLLQSDDERMRDIDSKNNKEHQKKLLVPEQLCANNSSPKPGPITEDYFGDRIIFAKKARNTGLKLLKNIPAPSLEVHIDDKKFEIAPNEVKWYEYVKKNTPDRPLVAEITASNGNGKLYMVVDFVKDGFHNASPKVSEHVVLHIEKSKPKNEDSIEQAHVPLPMNMP